MLAIFGAPRAVHGGWSSLLTPPSSVALCRRPMPKACGLELVSMLFALEKQLGIYRRRIEELFESHPDHDLFGSLPGAGPKLAPRLLAKSVTTANASREAQSLQCLAGTAPVTNRTGKHRECHQRWACDKHLRHAMHLFSEQLLLAASGPRSTTSPSCQKFQSHAEPCVASLSAGSKSSIECGWIEHPTTQSYTTRTRSNTVRGSSNSKQLTATNLHKKSLANR